MWRPDRGTRNGTAGAPARSGSDGGQYVRDFARHGAGIRSGSTLRRRRSGRTDVAGSRSGTVGDLSRRHDFGRRKGVGDAAIQGSIVVTGMLPQPYLLFLGDERDPAHAKTAFGLRDWARDRCVGE